MNKEIIARYPSNIALVKYWGKYGNQLPCNPSVSMTLSEAFTEVKLEIFEKQNQKIELEYLFEGKRNDAFKSRILTYLSQQKEFESLLKNYAFRVSSHNSFPHSAGIASSASAFAAIAAVFLKAANNTENDFNKKASYLARLGSGSACRSFYGSYAAWGKIDSLPGSDNEFAIPVTAIHEDFKTMRDAILIVEDSPKKVSSSVGHGLMNNHPYAEARFVDAKKHSEEILRVLQQGDFDAFISITEREALSLHAMMMTSSDYYMLMKPGTVEIINQVFEFRQESGLPVCFTLDAGPNIHLLYPEKIESQVNEFLEIKLKGAVKSIIFDKAGEGGTFV